MNAVNGEKSTLEAWESALDMWMYGGMVAVLAGVIIEIVPDFLSSGSWLMSVAHRIGGSILALGLLDEFVVDIKVRKCRARLKEIANSEFGEILTRAVQAENAAAEANLARAKLEERVIRRSVSRNLNGEEERSLIDLLRKHSGQKFTLRESGAKLESNDADKLQATDFEQVFFAVQLRRILSGSGWIHENIVNLPDFRVTKGITIFCRQGKDEGLGNAATDLWVELGKLDIACQISVRPEYFPVPMIICVGLL
jgi:hypothetical protein